MTHVEGMVLLTRTGIRINRYCSIADFPFLKIAAVRHLGFLKVKNFNFRSGSKAQYASLYQILRRSNRSGDMADFRFFKMAAAAILDFGNLKFLTVGTLKRVELRLLAKFCRNRSNPG